jgi:SAM-dependent methyltransferase
MDDPASGTDIARGHGIGGNARQYYKRDFWGKENLKFVEPHFRLEKAARIINNIAQGRECDLLDVGCGPATLQHLLGENVHYHGIDMAIHDPAPNLIEADFLQTPIKFGDDRLFDIVLAQGVFEYVGSFQDQKFSEISKILTEDGKFIVSYWNFGHRNKDIYWPFSNIQSLNNFRQSLEHNFRIDRFFPVGHNWHHREPGRKLIKAAQMHVNIHIPFISPVLAVEYFFICSPNAGLAPDRDALAAW